MHVVRSRRAPNRYVVAIRGTNPISLSDWMFGDLWVGETIDRPYAPATDPATISKSTALGVAALQAMRSRAPATLSPTDVSALVARTFSALARPAVGVSGDLLAAAPAWLESQIGKIAERLQDAAARAVSLGQRRQSAVAAPIAPSDLRPRLGAEPSSDGRRDLLTFLRSEAERGAGTPLEIAVTGHSKGGALAQVVAVWLKDALDSADPRESWDSTRAARVECYAFAGPTPGDAGFARRIERTLGANHRHLRNTNDVVTNAWQRIPALYGGRSAVFEPLIESVAGDVERFGYRHAHLGVTPFAGELDAGRDFAHEFVYQHLEAYLARTRLHDHDIRTVTVFI